ncbi:amidohydrolase family protein [Alteromonas gilva]|uniref:Amidohydrolase family protein n=1 Tax=Alteromonas gilva TaxID=2987522 RepID=A0ABT5L597_9ALTE|nr:amidohydrolase family protein [Alteromonas gilva]MDC8832234.1 amidohydrolase family protein [Alteromonas gilva]
MRLRFLTAAIVLVTACSGEAPTAKQDHNPPSESQQDATTAAYKVIFGGTDVGSLTVTNNGTVISLDYGFSNNGRGASSQETLLLSEAGLPINWTITGNTTFGNQVDERFEIADGKATWRSAAGKGADNAVDAPLYIAQNPSPYAYYVYAKTVLDAGGEPYPALPSGQVTVTPLRELTLTGKEGSVGATLYAVGGIDLNPTYILLDTDERFIGVVSPRFAILPDNLSGEDARLRELAATLNSERYENIAANVTHQYNHPVRINNVRIFDPHTLALTEPRSVVVTGKTIAAIEPRQDGPGTNEVFIEGNGGTLVAGLYDMHGHMGDNQALLNVMAGVTGVRDMGNEDAVLSALIDKIERGILIGPTITKSGFIEGVSDFSAATGELAPSKDDALALVRDYADKGYWQIKIYNSMNGDWIADIVEEAHRLGLRVAGHVPAFYRADQMIEAGYDELTHINQIMLGWVLEADEDTRTLFRITGMKRFVDLDLSGAKAQRTLDLMVKNNIAHDPTAVIHEYAMTGRNGITNNAVLDYIDHMPVSVQRQAKSAMLNVADDAEDAAYRAAYDKILATLSLMHQRGILLVPGTDMGGAFYLHRELELFTQIGMTAAEALKRGSYDMARYLGHSTRGAVKAGNDADFFLIPGDPTKDLKAIKTISMVATQGKFYFPTEVYPEFGIQPFTDVPKVTEPAR